MSDCMGGSVSYHLSLQCLSYRCVIIAVIRDYLKDAQSPAVMSNPFGDVIRFKLFSISIK